LAREEILQPGIHHETAALEYSRPGWRACVGLVYRLTFCCLFALCTDLPWVSTALNNELELVHVHMYPG
jgi:hypothetical protein